MRQNYIQMSISSKLPDAFCGTPEMAYFNGYNGRKGFRELLVAQE